MKNENVKNIRRNRPQMGHPGPGGGPRGMMPGEKAKDFKGTLLKTFRYMRRDVWTIVIAFALAIASVILTLTVPDILGSATDELLGGAIQKTYYNAAVEIRDSIPDISEEQLENMGISPDATLGELIDMGYPLGDVDESMLDVKVSALLSARDAQTVGEFFNALGLSERFSVAESYRDRVMSTSM